MQQVKLQSLQLPIAPNVRMSLKRDPGAEAGWLGVDRARVYNLAYMHYITRLEGPRPGGSKHMLFFFFFLGGGVSLFCVLYCK